ncbi:MAG: PID-CTERM protein-sorting domain-containing protein [Flavobacteriales bacterium]
MFKFLLVLFFSGLALYGLSQGFPSGGGPGFPSSSGPPCGPPFGAPCPIPLDGGVGFLIAAGLVYGGKKFRDSKTEQ